ncbi:hypothetical protein [Sinomicrobium sp. M5D2P17]
MVTRCTYGPLVLLFVIVLNVTSCQRKAPPEQQQKDRISLWLARAATDTISPSLRKEFLHLAYTRGTQIENDSLKQHKLSDIAYQAYQYGEYAVFKKAGRPFNWPFKGKIPWVWPMLIGTTGPFTWTGKCMTAPIITTAMPKIFLKLLPTPIMPGKCFTIWP